MSIATSGSKASVQCEAPSNAIRTLGPFYAVHRGFCPGIYNTWSQCEAQVKGYEGASFRKFSTKQEADAFVQRGTPKQTVKKAGRAKNLPKAADALSGSSQKQVGRHPSEILLYTDGSCPGNVGSASKQGAAGWGIVVLKPAGAEPLDFYGPVLYNRADPLFLGATCGTNNTGELTAVAMALKWVEEMEPTGIVPCRVLYDSKYAANIAQGLWRASGNVELAENSQACLKDATAKGRQVSFEHVKGHSGDTYNDRADRNANRGAAGQRQIWERPSKPLLVQTGQQRNKAMLARSFFAGTEDSAKRARTA